jgi:signal transduction histidine kinase/CheY-like chemotaxis protein
MVKERTKSLEDELLLQLASQARHAPFTVLCSVGIIAYLILQHVPHLAWLVGLWVLAEVLGQVLRVRILTRLPEQISVPASRRLGTAAAVNALNVSLHLGSLIAFPLLTPFEAAVVTMLFIGMGFASIITTLGHPAFVRVHLAISLVPTFALWYWSGLFGPGGTTGLLVALVGTSYVATVYYISKKLYDMAQDYFLARTRLDEALTQAEEAGNAKSRFLAAASHDLRQPMHTLVMLSAALGLQPLNERSREICGSIDKASRTLAGQLDALLDISRLDAGVIAVDRVDFSLSDMLNSLFSEFERVAKDKRISLQQGCPPGVDVHTDPLLLERVLRNLLSNAVKHNEDCTLSVVVNSVPDGWSVCVWDNGKGIPIKEQERIFEEFYQLENPERDRSRGLGLGLSIVRRLASLLDLSLRFESTPGAFTRFTLTVPQSRGVSSADDTRLAREREATALSVLVVDDEEEVRESMHLLLEELGHQVSLAGCTDSALALATEDKPDLALVDFRLRGGESGLDTIRELRRQFPGLPGILVSGETAPGRLQEAAAAGVVLLSKPVLPEQLEEAILAVGGVARPAH